MDQSEQGSAGMTLEVLGFMLYVEIGKTFQGNLKDPGRQKILHYYSRGFRSSRLGLHGAEVKELSLMLLKNCQGLGEVWVQVGNAMYSSKLKSLRCCLVGKWDVFAQKAVEGCHNFNGLQISRLVEANCGVFSAGFSEGCFLGETSRFASTTLGFGVFIKVGDACGGGVCAFYIPLWWENSMWYSAVQLEIKDSFMQEEGLVVSRASVRVDKAKDPCRKDAIAAISAASVRDGMGSTVDHGAAQDGGDVDVRSWKSRDTLKLKDHMDSTFEMCLRLESRSGAQFLVKPNLEQARRIKNKSGLLLSKRVGLRAESWVRPKKPSLRNLYHAKKAHGDLLCCAGIPKADEGSSNDLQSLACKRSPQIESLFFAGLELGQKTTKESHSVWIRESKGPIDSQKDIEECGLVQDPLCMILKDGSDRRGKLIARGFCRRKDRKFEFPLDERKIFKSMVRKHMSDLACIQKTKMRRCQTQLERRETWEELALIKGLWDTRLLVELALLEVEDKVVLSKLV
ncbi:hypothetical protein AAG906_022038 [Vitis piasezkii]